MAINPPITFDKGQIGDDINLVPIPPILYNSSTQTIGISAASEISSGVVNTGAQNIVGVKTFIDNPRSDNVPVNNTDLTNKSYVDNMILMGVTWVNSVISIYDFSTPPGTPSDGDRYISSTTTGSFTQNYIYQYDGSSWIEIIPHEGYATFVTDVSSLYGEQVIIYNDSGTWTNIGNSINHNSLINKGVLTHSQIDNYLLDVVTPQQFGAIGDGIADDTVAITSFFSQSESSKRLYIPRGTYLCNSNITINYGPTTLTNGYEIRGLGSNESVIQMGDGFSVSFDTLYSSGYKQAENIKLIGFQINGDINGILVGFNRSTTFRNVEIDDVKIINLNVNSSAVSLDCSTLLNCKFNHLYAGGNSSGTGYTACRFIQLVSSVISNSIFLRFTRGIVFENSTSSPVVGNVGNTFNSCEVNYCNTSININQSLFRGNVFNSLVLANYNTSINSAATGNCNKFYVSFQSLIPNYGTILDGISIVANLSNSTLSTTGKLDLPNINTGNITLRGASNVTLNNINDGDLEINAGGNDVIVHDSDNFIIDNRLTINGPLYFFGETTGASIINNYAPTTGLLINANGRLTLSSDDFLSILNTNQSTSAITGAIQCAGGIGCLKNIFCGGIVNTSSISMPGAYNLTVQNISGNLYYYPLKPDFNFNIYTNTLPNGGGTFINMGKYASDYNRGYLKYNHISDGSLFNNMTLGIGGATYENIHINSNYTEFIQNTIQRQDVGVLEIKEYVSNVNDFSPDASFTLAAGSAYVFDASFNKVKVTWSQTPFFILNAELPDGELRWVIHNGSGLTLLQFLPTSIYDFCKIAQISRIWRIGNTLNYTNSHIKYAQDPFDISEYWNQPAFNSKRKPILLNGNASRELIVTSDGELFRYPNVNQTLIAKNIISHWFTASARTLTYTWQHLRNLDTYRVMDYGNADATLDIYNIHKYYDNGTTTPASATNNDFLVHQFRYYAGSNETVLVLSQKIYDFGVIDDVVFSDQDFTLNQWLGDALQTALCAYVILKVTTGNIDYTDSTECKFVPVY